MVSYVLKLVPFLKKSNYSPGLYSGLFAIYLQCLSKKSIIFYAVCLLYGLSAATFVADLVAVLLQVSNNSICKNTFLYISCADTSRNNIPSS